jgi:hypothetical protein
MWGTTVSSTLREMRDSTTTATSTAALFRADRLGDSVTQL